MIKQMPRYDDNKRLICACLIGSYIEFLLMMEQFVGAFGENE